MRDAVVVVGDHTRGVESAGGGGEAALPEAKK
jgi:hypothetical protein